MLVEDYRIRKFQDKWMLKVYGNSWQEFGGIPEEFMELAPWVANNDCVIDSFGENPEARQVIVKSGQQIPIMIAADSSHFPPLENKYPLLPSMMRRSTRSCIAQAGGFILTRHQRGGEDDILSDKDLENLARGGSIHLPHFLVNVGPNDLIFEVGDPIVRLFYTNPRFMIVGDGLLEQVKQGLVNGKVGGDFYFVEFANKDFQKEEKLCIALALKVSPKRLVPKSHNPLRITCRKELYAAMEETTEQTSAELLFHPFQLRETEQPLKLDRNVIGELSSHTSFREPKPTHASTTQHWPSHLIDGGTQWRVRLEVLGNEPVDYVFLTLFWTPSPTGVVAPVDTYDPSLRS